MTVETDNSKAGPYAGAGTTGPYPVTFRFLDNSHLSVVQKTAAGVETILQLSVDFTATGAGTASGGTVTTTAAVPVGSTLTIQLIVPITQLTDYVQSDSFPAQSHEDALDKLTMIAQYLYRLVSSALRVPETTTTFPTLPSITDRALKALTFDSLGNPLAVAPSSGSATELATSLASSSTVDQGAGQVGFNAALSYSAGTVGKRLTDLATATGAASIGVRQPYTGGIARTQADKNAEYLTAADMGLSTGNTGAANAAALLVMLQSIPAGSSLWIPPGDYPMTSVSATPLGSLTIWGFGARFVNTTQVAVLGVPILRLNGTSSKDFNILGLGFAGPRLTSDAVVGTGLYSGTGYPSGLDIKTARKAYCYMVRATGTFYAGIEAHYLDHFIVDKCSISNHGYSGITWSDTLSAEITGNRIDDIGSVMITNGWGINSATSYNSPSAGYNDSVYIAGNNVTNCKRKCIDLHSGLNARVIGNTVKGFGYAGIYAVCEGVDKQIRDVEISGNHVYGGTGFVASASAAGIQIGQFTGTLSQDSTFSVHDNKIINLTAPYAIFGSNGDSGTFFNKSIAIHDNQVVGGSYTSGVFFNNNTAVYQMLDVHDNAFNGATCSGAGINARIYTSARIERNDFKGTVTGGAVTYDSLTGLTIGGNTLNGVGDVIYGSATYDPPNVAVGASTTTTVTATGAALGDYAQASSSIDLQGMTVTAYVSAANTVTVIYANNTAGALNLASGTLCVRVQKVYV